MRKPKVLTNYSSVRQTNLATVAQSAYDGMLANVSFPTPPVLLPAFLILINTYIAKLGLALFGNPLQTADKDVAKAALLSAMRKNAIYVNTTADGDLLKLSSSGFVLAKTPQPKGPFAVPALFKVTASPEPGRATIEFAGQPGATYLVRLTPNAATDRHLWPTAVDTRRTFNVDGLTSGTRYTFIGAYKGASNVLNFSVPVEVVIQ